MNLTDDQWLLLQHHFPSPPPRRVAPASEAKQGATRGRPAWSDRSILDAIFWVRRTGSPWSDLPPGYPSYLTCRRRQLEWTRSGLMRRILALLMDDLLHRGGLDLSRLHPDGLLTARQLGRTYYITAHPDLIGTWQLSTAMIFLVPHLKRLARRRRLKVVYRLMPAAIRELDG